ncbi:MAG: PEGA domain-containing protein [Defluviitaleaceae bacterium]|nr:PEGA domain-containing protein [Defluviitaleaceae bacterium]
MSDDKNNRNNASDDDFNYDDYSLDNYRYDEKYDDYEDYGDETPLTSSQSSLSSSHSSYRDEPPSVYDDEPTLEREEERVRPASRRETIGRVAQDVQNGLPRKPGITAPDTRLASAYASRRTQAAHRTHNRPPRSTPTNNPRPRQQKGPNSKAVFTGFFIAFLMLAIGLVLVGLLILISNVNSAVDGMPFFACSDPAVPPDAIVNNPAEPVVLVDMSSQTSMITGISISGATRTLTLLDITTHRTADFNVPEDTRILDRHNGPLTFGELRVGNMIDISYDRNTSNIAALNESRQAWTRPGRTNVNIDIEDFTVTLGNESWNFNSQTLVLYRGEPFSITQVRPINSVTLIGQGDTVWLVQVDAAHGFLQFTNTDMVANPRIMIGTNIVLGPEDITSDIDLAEGSHRIMIEGDNIEPFIDEIVIHQGQTTRLNMGDIPLRAAIINIAVSPDDAIIIVNGEEHENTAPAQVEFGENLVRVEREGFIPQEQQLDISQAISWLTFELVEISHEGTLVIFTVPTNAEIFVDNVFVGHSPHTQSVAPGNITVTARLPGHADSQTSIIVTGNETEDIMRHLMLSPDTGDPLQGQPPHQVDPINTPAPFPTLPPANTPTPTPTPFPTLPPAETPTPGDQLWPPGGGDQGAPGNEITPTPTPTPFNPFPDFEILNPDNQWWLTPPTL